MYPIHEKPTASFSFDRLDILWERYPQYHERTTFGTLDDILEEHESYQKDFDEELRNEYLGNDYGRFLVNLSWSDLAYRHATKELITASPSIPANSYVESFMDQFRGQSLSTRSGPFSQMRKRSITWLSLIKRTWMTSF